MKLESYQTLGKVGQNYGYTNVLHCRESGVIRDRFIRAPEEKRLEMKWLEKKRT
jgi:hypothetical protein